MTARSRTPLIIAIVILAMGIAGLVAVAVGRDDGSSPSAGSPTTDATETSGAAEIVYGEVEVQGTPLPALPGDPAAPDPAVGQVAPTLVGTTYGGEPLTIAPGEDGPLMVVFLAHWCPHCNDEIPVLLEWRESGAIPDELQIVGVSTAVSEERPNFPPAEWLAEKGWDWPTLADDEELSALSAYGGTGFPFFVVIGADGQVKARGSGELPVEQLDALVDAALA